MDLPKEAQEDIKVFKVYNNTQSDNTLLSLYRKAITKNGKQQQVSFTYFDDFYNNKLYVETGYHSFKYEEDAKVLMEFINSKHFVQFVPAILVECIIPKGSKYYEGSFDIYTNAKLDMKRTKSYASDNLTVLYEPNNE